MDGSGVILMIASVFYSVRKVRCQSKLHSKDTHLKVSCWLGQKGVLCRGGVRSRQDRKDDGCNVDSTGRMMDVM